jgi:hypothetical protein
MEGISAPQQEKIAQGIRSNIDRFANSGLFRAMQRDVEMFGVDAFTQYAETKPEDGEK